MKQMVGAWRFELQTSCAQGRSAKVRKAHSLNRFTEKPSGYPDLIGVAGYLWMCLPAHRVTTKVTTVA